MSLRSKLVFAQAPLALALALLGVVSGFVTDQLGEEASRILADNYRSVLAAQRMKENLERLDSLALFVLAGRTADAALLGHHRQSFENELRVEEDNVTEPGEGEAAKRLRSRWLIYRQALAGFLSLEGRAEREAHYFAALAGPFTAVKTAADEILTINQDAMVRKSQRAERRAKSFQTLMIVAVIGLLLLGLVGSTTLTTRLLRPLGIVAAAVRRFGGGDLQTRARVQVRDEIGGLAADFNTMAEKLERYRQSSLGELLQAQQSAQSAIDALPDPVVLLDAGGGLLGQNRAASELLRIDRDIAQGDPLSSADPSIRAAFDRFRTHVASGKGGYVPKGFEDAIRTPTADGERVFLPRAAPMYGEAGEVLGTAAVFQDITRLFRADELKDNLVATVAHEFRTPLTSLRMALHLCVEGTVGPLTDKQADLLFAGREECERLQTIVDELLNLSRIEAGRIDLNRRRVSPGAMVDLALDVHRQTALDRHVTLKAELPRGLPELFADPDRLQLVFTNLITNAIRYSPEGGEISLRVRAEPSEVGGAARVSEPGFVRFEIGDQGPGVAPEHQAGLFEKFFRVPGSPEGGSGLGLFIAKGLVQAHGGDIGLDSRQGAGANFWFRIPSAPLAAR